MLGFSGYFRDRVSVNVQRCVTSVYFFTFLSQGFRAAVRGSRRRPRKMPPNNAKFASASGAETAGSIAVIGRRREATGAFSVAGARDRTVVRTTLAIGAARPATVTPGSAQASERPTTPETDRARPGPARPLAPRLGRSGKNLCRSMRPKNGFQTICPRGARTKRGRRADGAACRLFCRSGPGRYRIADSTIAPHRPIKAANPKRL